jgi:dCTP deaminase
MSVIGGKGLNKLLYHTEDLKKRLVITPILDPKKQIDESSAAVDIRLGTKFIIPQRAEVAYIDVNDPKLEDTLRQSVEVVYIPYGKSLTLHPGHFILGSSLEYFRLPRNLSGYVVSRSSWGRIGLVVATAIGIHPGFFGVLCLEISNSAEVPISLYPGLTIAQIFFHEVKANTTDLRAFSQYLGATEAELPNLSPRMEIVKLSRLAK